VPDLWIEIRLGEQRMRLMQGDTALASYPVSTALRGAGEQMGSERTPRGEHEVRELIGRDAPPGAVFTGRRPTGEVWSAEAEQREPDRDWILSRIIWLGGLEEGRNRGGTVDTQARLVYIHGTPDSQPMGEPRSHGCIRMRNSDVIELFERIEVGTRVRIEE